MMIVVTKIKDRRAGGRVSQTTVLAELLGLAGMDIDLAEREADGSWTVHVRTAAVQGACCPGLGAGDDADQGV